MKLIALFPSWQKLRYFLKQTINKKYELVISILVGKYLSNFRPFARVWSFWIGLMIFFVWNHCYLISRKPIRQFGNTNFAGDLLKNITRKHKISLQDKFLFSRWLSWERISKKSSSFCLWQWLNFPNNECYLQPNLCA